MKPSVEKALSYLTGSNDLSKVSVDDLQNLIAESPYFAVTRFLLTKKLSDNKDQYEPELQKTALYFSNPHWLTYQIANTKGDLDNSIANEPLDFKEDILATSNTTALSSQPIQSIDQDDKKQNTNIDEVEPGIADLTNVNIIGAPVQADEEAAVIGRGTDEETNEAISHIEEVAIPRQETIQIPVALPQEEIVEYREELAGASTETEETGEFLKELSPASQQQESSDLDDEHDKMFRNIKAMLDASAEEADAETKDAVIPIDPYYTIDYFASQGIKLELEPEPQDQLGQHLKKFTQWLKHMKKLGPEDATEVIKRSETEAHIQQIADSSNTVREVVTEAMALVLEKQGKKEKAIELYNKLSFLNPDKNAYFADKIKKLKGT